MRNNEYRNKAYILTEKGAESFRRFGTPAQAGDPYNRKVPEDVLKEYIRAGFITKEAAR